MTLLRPSFPLNGQSDGNLRLLTFVLIHCRGNGCYKAAFGAKASSLIKRASWVERSSEADVKLLRVVKHSLLAYRVFIWLG